MKTKDKDKHESRSSKSNEDERSPVKDTRVNHEQSIRGQKKGADKDVETALSKGFFPDGPGGNYKGV